MCICIYIYEFAQMYIYVYVFLHIVEIYTSTHSRTHRNIWKGVYINIYTYIFIYVYTYIYIYMHIYISIKLCTFIHMITCQFNMSPDTSTRNRRVPRSREFSGFDSARATIVRACPRSMMSSPVSPSPSSQSCPPFCKILLTLV